MRPAMLIANAVVTLYILTISPAALAQRNKKKEEPKTQVLPLPPELPMAIAADTEGLDFHISPLLKTGGLSAQIRQSLNDLIRDTKGETIVKLRAFVAGAGDARRVQAETAEIFTERKLPLPVLSIIQVGALGGEAAQVVIEAVVSTRRPLNPNGLAFLAGQSGPSFSATLNRLEQSVKAASIAPEHVLTCTCFTSRLDSYAEARGAVQAAFPNSAINLVQALRDPASDSATCEAVGQLNQPPEAGPVVWLKTARATLVNSRRLGFHRAAAYLRKFSRRCARSRQPVAARCLVHQCD